ncbi:MAG: hypothetical protein ACYCST_04385 [Acidimicrobiales bacterium]
MTETMQAAGPVTYDEAVELVRCAVQAAGPIGDLAPAGYLAQVKDLALSLRGVALEVVREAGSVVRSFTGTGTLSRVVERYRTQGGKVTDLGRVVISPDHGKHEAEEIWIDLRIPSGPDLVERAKDFVGMAVRYSRESRTEMTSDGPRINPETGKPQTRPYLVAIDPVADLAAGRLEQVRGTDDQPVPAGRPGPGGLAAIEPGGRALPRTSRDLLAMSAERFGLGRGSVARIVVSTCGELKGEQRSPGEIGMAWVAICDTYGDGEREVG